MIFSLGSSSDSKVFGNVKPFPEEQLQNKLILSDLCKNIFIIEFQDNLESLNIKRLNKLCNNAIKNFASFLKQEEILLKIDKPFIWELSFLIDSDCYRCLNDTEYRFNNRKTKVFGYTSGNEKITFITNDFNLINFDEIFLHELFHAMSFYYGLFDLHGKTLEIKLNKDEYLARKFPIYLKHLVSNQ